MILLGPADLIEPRGVNRTLSLLVGLSSFWGLASLLYAMNPDLALAPLPQLSQTAWKELLKTVAANKTVILHAQISAFGGIVSNVTIEEVQQWPVTSSEVQLWIRHKWRFTRDFSGKVVQPVSFQITHTAPQPSSTPDPRNEQSDVLLRSPSPPYPTEDRHSIRNYMSSNGVSMPGVLLQMTASNGTITDIRVIEQHGPNKMCEYIVEWVRNNWRFRPDVTGTFRIPVYYRFSIGRAL